MIDENKFILKKMEKIAFFGDAEVKPESEPYQMAYRGAKLLAEKGYTIVNGGGPGVMEAATKGAESVGGETVIVTFEAHDAPGFEGLGKTNKADRDIVYNNYPDRLKGLLTEADAYLLFKGGTGTLSELGMVWVMAKIYFGKHKPFVLVGDFWRPIIKAVEENMLLDGREIGLPKIVDEVEEAVELIEEWGREVRRMKVV